MSDHKLSLSTSPVTFSFLFFFFGAKPMDSVELVAASYVLASIWNNARVFSVWIFCMRKRAQRMSGFMRNSINSNVQQNLPIMTIFFSNSSSTCFTFQTRITCGCQEHYAILNKDEEMESMFFFLCSWSTTTLAKKKNGHLGYAWNQITVHIMGYRKINLDCALVQRCTKSRLAAPPCQSHDIAW